ncbi:hypothetical protein FXB41_36455 [Bradyrhizobium canariense]|nr:hypothetical protein [Bradyrhizobium canariense]
MAPLSPHHCEELLRRSNPGCRRGQTLDCFAALAMTENGATSSASRDTAAPALPLHVVLLAELIANQHQHAVRSH